MGRVFQSETTGAGVYVFAADHCPPHVHARHRGQEWVARVRFSYAHDKVALMSIAPLRTVPSHRVVDRLLDDVQAHLAACRRGWWTAMKTTCLTNQRAIVRAADAMSVVSARTPAAKRIVAAIYDPEGELLRVDFDDRTKMELKLDK